MADYRKSFNFRNGVQVDNDNLVVNSNGLVGIGTTVPTETLDVRGTLRVVGLATADSINSKDLTVSGVTTLTSANIGNLSINSSGIITAVSGVVTFYGDGSTLSNLPTSQWIDVDVGLGFTSIYAAGNVGVATTNPGYTFQVGGNPNNQNGIGINSTGDINISGIATAANFYGKFNGGIDGDVYSTGISTFTSISVGVITASTSFVGNLTGDVVGIATTARGLIGTPNITVGIVTADIITANTINVTSTGIVTATKLLHVGTGGTAFSALEAGRIGVGTDVPTSEIQIRKASGSLVEVISDSGQAQVSIGNSVGAGKSTGVIRFGNSAHDLDIINNDNEGDINFLLNGNGSAGTGKFSWQDGNSFTEVMSLNANGHFSVSGVTTLASAGGITTTGGDLYVGGNVTASNFIGDVSIPSVIASNLNINTGISTVTHLDIVANGDPLASTKLTLDTNATVGLGTTQPIVDFDARSKTALFGSVGINTTNDSFTPSLYVGGNVAIEDSVGIGTTASINGGSGLEIHTGFLDLYDTRVSIESNSINVSVIIDDKTTVGIGSTQPKAAVDLSLAGKGESSGQYAYLILPKVTNSERSGFASTESGAIIFNTDTSTFQGYTGIGWTDLH
jgi:hypothetical protein